MARAKTRRARPGGGWQRFFLAAVGLCAIVLVANVTLDELRPGNAWSLGYGVAATLFLVAAVAYGWRRRIPAAASRWRLGSAAWWLGFHRWGSLLFLLLMLMHSGFRWPTGWLNGWIWGLSWWTVLSGLIGLGFQRWIPKVLSSGLTTEVLYDRIPELVNGLRQRAEDLVANSGEAMRRLYDRDVAPALAGPDRHLIYFFDVTGGISQHLSSFHYLRTFLPADEGERLDQLEQIYRSKLEIDAHYTLQQVLRGWLYAHVPPSILLVGLVILHILSVLIY